MNLYEPKQLADSMRVVRKNTIAIAVAAGPWGGRCASLAPYVASRGPKEGSTAARGWLMLGLNRTGRASRRPHMIL